MTATLPTTTAADRVVQRHLVRGTAPRDRIAAMVLRGPGSDTDWGWYTPGPPRMHLRTMGQDGPEHVVWLEDDAGRRSFLPSPSIAPEELAWLHTLVRRHRDEIEQRWSVHMILMGWVRTSVTEDGDLVVTAYDGLPTNRSVVLSTWCGERGFLGRTLTDADVDLDSSTGDMILGAREPEMSQIRVPLAAVIFRNPSTSPGR